jgi:hypothetical protein
VSTVSGEVGRRLSPSSCRSKTLLVCIRFRSAQERRDAEAKAAELGEPVEADNLFDSNVITPGTDFMTKVGLF